MTGTDISDLTDLAGDISAEQVTTFLGAASLGFGAAGMLAPTMLRRVYGVPGSEDGRNAGLVYLGRMWGSRTAVIGALALAASTKEDRKRVLTLAAGMNAFDAVVAATARSLPPRPRVMGALTSGFFAAASAYGSTLD